MDLSLKKPASPRCAFALAVTELYNWNLASQRVSFISPPLHTMPLLMGHHFHFLEMLPPVWKQQIPLGSSESLFHLCRQLCGLVKETQTLCLQSPHLKSENGGGPSPQSEARENH